MSPHTETESPDDCQFPHAVRWAGLIWLVWGTMLAFFGSIVLIGGYETRHEELVNAGSGCVVGGGLLILLGLLSVQGKAWDVMGSGLMVIIVASLGFVGAVGMLLITPFSLGSFVIFLGMMVAVVPPGVAGILCVWSNNEYRQWRVLQGIDLAPKQTEEQADFDEVHWRRQPPTDEKN